MLGRLTRRMREDRAWFCGTPVAIGLVVAAALYVGFHAGSRTQAADEAESPYASPTIDLGVVVSDIDASVKFYKEALGFEDAGSFTVPKKLGGDSGLSDYKPFNVRVLQAGDGEDPTRLKLMEFEGTDSKTSDETFIHSTLGYSYITLEVTDTSASLDRLKRAGVEPIAQGPVGLPEGFPEGIYLTVVKDPDGNFVELVGPKK